MSRVLKSLSISHVIPRTLTRSSNGDSPEDGSETPAWWGGECLTKVGAFTASLEELSQLGDVDAPERTSEKQTPLGGRCGGRAEEGKKGEERSVECEAGVSIKGNQAIGGSHGSHRMRGCFWVGSHLFVWGWSPGDCLMRVSPMNAWRGLSDRDGFRINLGIIHNGPDSSSYTGGAGQL